MRKFLYYLFPLIILGLFIFIMNSDPFLKKPMGQADNVSHYLSLLKKDFRFEQWDRAAIDLAKLKRAYQKVVPRIQFGAERDEMNRIQIGLARAEGAIVAQDKAGGLMEIQEAAEHWSRLGK